MPATAPRWCGKDVVRYDRPEAITTKAASTYAHKYDPDQPRVPAGNPDGGQWTGESGPVRVAARRISEALEKECEVQYSSDKFICNAFQSAACYNQAALRYANCLRELPIPPLNF